MATVLLSPNAKQKFDKLDGSPADGYKLHTYATGTTTPQATYSNRAGSSANANPIILDARGEATVYLTPGLVYDYKLTSAADVLEWTQAGVTAQAGDAGAVYWTRGEVGAIEEAIASELARTIRPEHFGADPTGVALSDTAFATCAALGKTITLADGATYLLASGKSLITGSGFMCEGWATIKLKTGAGGFNITDQGGDRTGADRCVFSMVGIDNVILDGIIFEPDATTQAVIYPVRVAGGFNSPSKGLRIGRLKFRNFRMGVMCSLNSIGDGGYDIDLLWGEDLGTALGNTYWSNGLGQVTLFEIDNDLVAGVHSAPGTVKMVKGRNILLSGQALTDYGQQTDGINIGGVSNGTQRKGPQILNYDFDGVGEGIDIFGSGAVIRGGRMRNIHGFGIKLIHGASYNDIECGYMENVELAGVVLNGGTATTDTQGNRVRVGVFKAGAVLGAATENAAVLLSEQAGPGRAKNNVVTLDNVIGDGSFMKWVVRDGGADIAKGNQVDVGRARGWATAFSSAAPGNVSARLRFGTRAKMTMSANSATLTANVEAQVAFNTVVKDVLAEAVTASNKFRVATPGPKLVKLQLRIGGQNAGEDCVVRIKKNGVSVIQAAQTAGDGALFHTFEASCIIDINEDEVGTAAADLTAHVTVEGTTSVIQNTATMSFFEVTSLG